MGLIDATGIDWLHLHLKEALAEDLGDRGDITCQATINKSKKGFAELIAKEDGVLAGCDWAIECGKLTEPAVEWYFIKNDGDRVKKGEVIAQVNGSMVGILISERTALNGLGHLSGIATFAMKANLEVEGTRATVIDTRKTFPGWRIAQKYAVRMGGSANHRIGLYDEILIKENHIEASGGIKESIRDSQEYRKDNLKDNPPIEVEVESITELHEALKENPERILLDNFSIDKLVEAVKITDGKCILEASGGITMVNLRKVAETGVERISMGAMTHSVTPLDLSLLVKGN